jgi:hypothetical protein
MDDSAHCYAVETSSRGVCIDPPRLDTLLALLSTPPVMNNVSYRRRCDVVTLSRRCASEGMATKRM